ncbi:MAG: pirin family protein [Polyangiaceae bacterium]
MSKVILEKMELGFPWVTADPFLFCVHHDDAYPAGNEKMGPTTSLAGRNLGNDFVVKDGFRMYHGEVVPGFPQHPHRGFETVTIARRGYIDHSDSLGATARFGKGDAQWLTAGGGISHSEMFPLVEKDKPNPVELFQIWLNLPAEDKMVPAHFAMLWDSEIPRVSFRNASGRETVVTVIAGELDGKVPPPPPPKSWAARKDSDVAIWSIKMEAGATWTMPAAKGADTGRVIYFFKGKSVKVGDETLTHHTAAVVKSDEPIDFEAGEDEVEILLLQGKPIGQPVVQYGPFVMSSRAEIDKAMADYRKTRFGGWPWPVDDPVHARTDGRFAKHADGRVEQASEHAAEKTADQKSA